MLLGPVGHRECNDSLFGIPPLIVRAGTDVRPVGHREYNDSPLGIPPLIVRAGTDMRPVDHRENNDSLLGNPSIVQDGGLVSHARHRRKSKYSGVCREFSRA